MAVVVCRAAAVSRAVRPGATPNTPVSLTHVSWPVSSTMPPTLPFSLSSLRHKACGPTACPMACLMPHGMPYYGLPHGMPCGPPHGMPYGLPHGMSFGVPHGITHSMHGKRPSLETQGYFVGTIRAWPMATMLGVVLSECPWLLVGGVGRGARRGTPRRGVLMSVLSYIKQRPAPPCPTRARRTFPRDRVCGP